MVHHALLPDQVRKAVSVIHVGMGDEEVPAAHVKGQALAHVDADLVPREREGVGDPSQGVANHLNAFMFPVIACAQVSSLFLHALN